MYRNRQGFLTGWRGAPAKLALNLGKPGATSKGRRLAGQELERRKRELLEQYGAAASDKRQPQVAAQD